MADCLIRVRVSLRSEASNALRLSNSSSSVLLKVRPSKIFCASAKVTGSMMGSKAPGLRIHSDFGSFTVGVNSLEDVRPKTWHPTYFG
jgi:hypothetical protein